MSVHQQLTGFILVFVLAAGGCGTSSSSGGGGASMDDLAAEASTRKAQQDAEAAKQAEAAKAQADQAAAAPAAEPTKKLAGRERVGEGGYYTAIVGARRHALNEKDRWAWIQAVRSFQATEGRLPKDHAEFMSKVVEPLELDLGYKEENQEFFYDPNVGDFGEVFVVEKEETPAQ